MNRSLVPTGGTVRHRMGADQQLTKAQGPEFQRVFNGRVLSDPSCVTWLGSCRPSHTDLTADRSVGFGTDECEPPIFATPLFTVVFWYLLPLGWMQVC